MGLAEAPHLPRDQALAALAARRDRQAAALAWTRGTLATLLTQRGLPLRFVLDSDYEVALLAAEVAWLDDVVARIKADPTPWESDERLAIRRAPVGAAAHHAS